MLNEGPLRRRIIAAYVLLATVVCSFFAGAAYLTTKAIEDKLINDRLSAAIDLLIERHEQGLSTDSPVGPALLRGARLPPELRALPSGAHELVLQGREVHAVVRDHRDGRFVVVDDDTEFERMEVVVFKALGAGLAACVLLAVALGWIMASRVIAPVTALAEAVKQDALDDQAPSLALNDEIGMLARAFAARTAELRGFLVRERLFTADVSHELRTPLTIIIGAAEVLATQVGNRPDIVAAVERIRRAATDTADRVGALLLLSRSPQALDAPRLPLLPVVEREIERCRPLLADKPVTLVLEMNEDTWVFARPELAGMAVGNLLRNACLYTEQGTITLRLKPDSLVIEDTGPGLPQSVRAQLFERFVRGADGKESGAGLGLAIVKRIVEHLGWDIRLEDRVGGGSRFVLTFPD